MTRLERFLAGWLVYLLILWQARNHYYPTASVGAITVAAGCGALVAWWWSRVPREDRESAGSTEYRDPRDIANREAIRKWKARK